MPVKMFTAILSVSMFSTMYAGFWSCKRGHHERLCKWLDKADISYLGWLLAALHCPQHIMSSATIIKRTRNQPAGGSRTLSWLFRVLPFWFGGLLSGSCFTWPINMSGIPPSDLVGPLDWPLERFSEGVNSVEETWGGKHIIKPGIKRPWMKPVFPPLSSAHWA